MSNLHSLTLAPCIQIHFITQGRACQQLKSNVSLATVLEDCYAHTVAEFLWDEMYVRLETKGEWKEHVTAVFSSSFHV